METVSENEKTEAKRNVQFEPSKGEIRVLGVRCHVMNPISSCEKVDRMFGTGGEVIVHNVCYELGYEFFEIIMKSNPDKNKEDLLAGLFAAAREMGHGVVTTTTISENPPTVKIIVENPAVKTVQGSPKHTVAAFWAGILSKYFNKKLTCRDYAYHEAKDELSFVVST